MQMTQEELGELRAGTLPCQAVWKFSRDNRQIVDAQRLVAASDVKVAFGTDCGMFPFNHGILEFQAMVAAGLSPARALQAGTSVAAELLARDDIGVLEPGACADIVAMRGNPLDDIAATAPVDFVMRAVPYAGALDEGGAGPRSSTDGWNTPNRRVTHQRHPDGSEIRQERITTGARCRSTASSRCLSTGRGRGARERRVLCVE